MKLHKFERKIWYFLWLIRLHLKEVKEVPNTLNRLRESQMMSSIFPKYAVV